MHLVKSPALRQWQPRFPLSEIDERYVRDAERLREALLPGLSLPAGTSLTARARACADSFAFYAGGESLQRDVRHLLARTLARAVGNQNWNRIELFLDDDYVRKPQGEALDFPEIAATVAQLGKTDGLTAAERAQIWTAIVNCFAQRLESGGSRSSSGLM